MNLVQSLWNVGINGTKLYTLVSKHKKVKLVLKKLNRFGFSDIHVVELNAYKEIIAIREAMHHNPIDKNIADAEILVVQE